MGEDEDIVTAAPAASAPTSVPERRARAGRARGGAALWVVALLALALAGVALWRAYAREHGEAAARAAIHDELGARIDDLARVADQRKRDVDSLRARIADADAVNKSLREELLGLGERSRHLEDAVANLAEQRRSGRDALAMNEAEFLLLAAQERLALFHDATGALAAYRLADDALATAEDPVLASVRQTLAAERQALEASKPLETHDAIAALERVRTSLADLPPPRAAADADAPASRWQRFLAQFVRIRRDDAPADAPRDAALARSLVALDLRIAEAALLAHDADGCKAALARARRGLAVFADAQSAPGRDAFAALDRVAAQTLPPAPPELGATLKELRNLRATRALSPPATPASPPAPASNPVPASSPAPPPAPAPAPADVPATPAGEGGA
ncbi:MAG TPA: uroporphyrinogen-III C-methyltransferase [Dokdonella sp.]